MPELRPDQCAFFHERGYLMVENAVDGALLKRLKQDFAAWVEESRSHDAAWGDTVDGRPRFDLEPGHSAEKPSLRRVNAPVEVSEAYLAATVESRMADCVAELIGPDVKLHHTKINSKLPGGHTEVKWHQDFSFTPHSNDDVVTALLMVDEVTEENGPLQVLGGSHRGPIHSLWHEGVFTGAVADAVADAAVASARMCVGQAGAACLMHTRLLHGSTANRSARPRTLHISVYSAEDAVAISPNPVPSRYEGRLVSGQRTGRVRSMDYELDLPQLPTGASFFDQQARHGAPGDATS